MSIVKPEKSGGALGVVADVAILAGAGLTSYGAWRIYEPAGIITAGVIVLMFGLVGVMVRR